MSDGSNYLDPDRPEAVRLGVGDAQALGEAALARIGYVADDARIITDQLIDSALYGYRFAGLPRILAIASEAKTRDARVPLAVVHETPVSALVDGGTDELRDAHRARRPCRVRARLHSHTHERETRAGESPRCQTRSQAETDHRPASGNTLAPGSLRENN